MAKKKASGGAPRWTTTFADLSTLLLTFFVLLLSMANTDVIKFQEMIGSIREAFGVQVQIRGDYSPVETESFDSTKPGDAQYQPHMDAQGELMESMGEKELIEQARAVEAQQREEAAQDIREAIQAAGMGENAEVESGERGIRIRVKGALLFDAGRADLRETAKPFLDTITEVLNKFEYYLLVEGHTDSIPISTSQFASNWELSGARAAAVLRFLIDSGIDSKRLTAVGLADNYPIASNDTPEGRSQNRRVEFVLTKQPFRPQIE